MADIMKDVGRDLVRKSKVKSPGMLQEFVLARVAKERVYQDEKWGTLEENPHSIGGWLKIMDERLWLARQAYGIRTEEETLHEVRKLVAVAIACLEQHGCPERVFAEKEEKEEKSKNGEEMGGDQEERRENGA